MMADYRDYPVADVLHNMATKIERGHTCYVKFTCEGCGSRQTDAEPNRFCQGGYTCEECGHLTKPKGINFLLVLNCAAVNKQKAG